MVLLGWAVFGIVVGMVGSEVLRAKKPNMIGKVEGAAKRFVDSMYSDGSGEKQTGDKEKEGDENASH
jgi:hypothetical protein